MPPDTNLSSLRAFGAEAERLEYAQIDVGGFIVPGRGPAASLAPGATEDLNHAQRPPQAERSAPEQARSAAGSRKRSRAEATAATDPATQALGAIGPWAANGITAAEFGLLADYYPDVRVVVSRPDAIYLSLTAGLFADLPFRARLTLEVPRPTTVLRTLPFVPCQYGRLLAALPWLQLDGTPVARRPLVGGVHHGVPIVPPVRAWATWLGGPAHGAAILSHHQYQDLAICACMPYDWVRGAHLLVHYVGMCVSWIGKVVHERELGFYPGLQHYNEWVRVERDRPDEYCGCGRPRRYGDCCRDADRRLTPRELRDMEYISRRAYFAELARQHRPFLPPRFPA